jgi:signal transduction histidine kinase/ActR/RegA family two-component response regulator
MQKLYGTIVQHHDAGLVWLAGLVCLLGSYTAFSMMARLYAPRSRYPWVIAAAVVTGCGAWATHLIALLAFQPGVPVAYDIGMTVASGVIAIMGCGLGFYVARSTKSMALGGAIVGFAISVMHYADMAAVTFQAHVQWDILYVQVAILTGASFGAAALSRARLTPDVRGRIMGALLLTAGIFGTHFISLAGLIIVPDAKIIIPQDTLAIVWFAIALTAVVFLILGLGIVGNLVDQHIRDVEATKRDLEAALTLAETANRAKSEFLATMSHELRTPLNAVIGFSEMMVKEVFGPIGHQNYKDYAKDIHDSGSHLIEIINDILDISKAEAGKLQLSESEVDCRELIVASCRLVRPRLQQSKLALGLSLPDGLPRLKADARMVKQIVLNLLTNAAKFTNPGGRIEIEAVADLQCGLIITIRDTGIGIAKADLQRVRQPFVQVDSSLSRRHEGTGLGLPLVEIMMRQHGGLFELESEERKGTTARVLFPVGRLIWDATGLDTGIAKSSGGAALEPDVGEATVPIAAAQSMAFGKQRILVVEDDRDFCQVLQRILERAGFAATAASNGHEALYYVTTEAIDLVITDIVMPEMDGVELMRVLKKVRPNLPIIALSGAEDLMEYRRIAAHLGAQAALCKPIARADLIHAVNDALARHLPNDTGIDNFVAST